MHTDRPIRRRRDLMLLSPLNSPVRTRRASKLGLSPRELMLADIAKVWDRYKVPAFHREAFMKHLEASQRFTATALMERELEETVKRRSTVLRVMDAVTRREEILEQLKDMSKSQESEHIQRLDVQDALRQLQVATLDVVLAVAEWRDDLGDSTVAFVLNGKNYLHKVVTDVEDLRRMQVGRLMPEVKVPDPLLVHTLSLPLVRGKFTFRTNYRSDRLRRAEELLSREPPSPALFSQQVQSSLPNLPHPEDDSESLSSSLNHAATEDSRLSVLSGRVLDLLLAELANAHCHSFAVEACKEYVRAHLLLYSSKVLDDLIAIVVDLQLPIEVQEAYTEEVDREFIEFQKEMLETVVTLEVTSGVEEWALDIIAESLAANLAYSFDVEYIVKEAIQEEQSLNTEMRDSIFAQLVDCHTSEEWLELMCEDILSDEIMEDRFRTLPPHVVSQFVASDPGKYRQRVLDSIYTDMIQRYVGGLWLERLVRATVNEAKGRPPVTDEEVMVVDSYRRRNTHVPKK